MPVQQVWLKIPLEVSRPNSAPSDLAALMKLVNSIPLAATPKEFPLVQIARKILQGMVDLGDEQGRCAEKPGRNTLSQWRETKFPTSDPKAERRLAKRDPLFWAGVQALKGIELVRIRKCMICENFFWATRKDKKCCTKKCNGVWRTRRWRESYADKYKHQRYQKQEQADLLASNNKHPGRSTGGTPPASPKKSARPSRRAPRRSG